MPSHVESDRDHKKLILWVIVQGVIGMTRGVGAKNWKIALMSFMDDP